MLLKYILLLISAFLLVQLSHGKALPSSNQSDDSNTTTTINSYSPEQQHERIKILIFVFFGIEKIADSTLTPALKLLKDVVAEASEVEEKSQAITEKIEEYSKFIEKLETLKQNHGQMNRRLEKIQKFNAMVELSNLVQESNLTTLENPGSDDHLFSELLKKHGLEEVKKVNADKFVEFFEKFVPKAEYYWNSLTSEEQKNSEKFEKWFEIFKAENNVKSKIQIFALFFKSV